MKNKTKQKGIAMVMVLMLILVLSVVGSAIFDITQVKNKTMVSKQAHIWASHAADSGLEYFRALFKSYGGGNNNGGAIDKAISFYCGGMGTYDAANPPRPGNFIEIFQSGPYRIGFVLRYVNLKVFPVIQTGTVSGGLQESVVLIQSIGMVKGPLDIDDNSGFHCTSAVQKFMTVRPTVPEPYLCVTGYSSLDAPLPTLSADMGGTSSPPRQSSYLVTYHWQDKNGWHESTENRSLTASPYGFSPPPCYLLNDTALTLRQQAGTAIQQCPPGEFFVFHPISSMAYFEFY